MPKPLDRLVHALADRYTVGEEIGAGGMATVYVAHDVRHDRRVALKVLRPELAAVMGAERFLTEIRTTANLQHPHILALFDSGEAEGFLYYVMPYVEGDTLRDLLDREKQLPVEEAVRIARAVASALDYAHRHNVIHRDIKPANILLHDGQPVVADFGIALAVQQAGGGRLTETGLSLGTPYYMSPEQATADRDPGPRSDVYSLGCVLYEMLAGEPPFQGGTAQAVLGRILTGDTPSVTSVRKTVPRHVDAAVTRALQRLPADRFATAAEFSDALGRPELAGTSVAGAASGASRTSWIPWTVAALAIAALGWSLAVSRQEAPAPRPVMRSVIELPLGSYLTNVNLALSDDGRQIVAEASVDGRRMLMARPSDALSFRPIPGTSQAGVPVLSPDGADVAYRQGSLLVRAPVAGGTPQVLATGAGNVTVGQWAADGFLYYAPSYKDGVERLPATGGAPQVLTRPDFGRNELAHWWAQLLPDGDHVLYTAFRTPVDSAELAVVSLSTGETKTVLKGGLTGRYVSTGHLVYARNDALFAVPFDLDALEVRGTPVVVVDDLAIDHTNGRGGFAISETGTLIYVPASEYYAPNDLVWVDRSGREERIPVDARTYADPAISPDGRRLALSITEPGESPDVWVLDLARSTLARITSGGASDFAPVWSADGRDLIFESEQPVFDLYTRPADGSRPARPLVQNAWDKYPVSVQGTKLTYMWETIPEQRAMTLDLESGAVDTLFASEADLSNPSISPDGRWLAYTSDESGVHEVYISSHPDVTQSRRQISSGGGQEARWTRGGRELVYRAGPDMMSVALDPETGEPGPPVRLFGADYIFVERSYRSYDVTADGERFILMKLPPERAPRRIVVVSNFFEELRGIVP